MIFSKIHDQKREIPMTIKRKTQPKRAAELFHMDARAIYLHFDLLDQEVAEFKANGELEKARQVVREAKKFFQTIPKGEIRTQCLEILRKQYYGYSWRMPLPETNPGYTQVEEDPIGKRFSDNCPRFDDFGIGGWREKH